MGKHQSLENEPRLVYELSKGNILAFNTLYREYGKRIYKFSYRYLRSAEEAEEIVQEVFTRIWEKRKDLKESLSFKSYVFTITFNIIRRHFKVRAMMDDYLQHKGWSDHDLQTTEKIDFNSLNQYVKALVDKLPDRRKQIFIKSRYEGLNTMEIATELKISSKTVENQLTDALRFIRSHLKNENFKLILYVLIFYNV